jgi:hypothetical protein
MASDPYLHKSLEELLEDLGRPVAQPGPVTHEQIKAVIQVRMMERMARPSRWALVSIIAACVSAAGAVAAVIAQAVN